MAVPKGAVPGEAPRNTVVRLSSPVRIVTGMDDRGLPTYERRSQFGPYTADDARVIASQLAGHPELRHSGGEALTVDVHTSAVVSRYPSGRRGV
ncbi:MAG: hypothetical protein KGJ07_01340 [Patescibacteria group bacterium]|nr:hypothetical protein [Patescibacteria group bacterium]